MNGLIDIGNLPIGNYLITFFAAYAISLVQLSSKNFPGDDLSILVRLGAFQAYGLLFGLIASFLYWGLCSNGILSTGWNFESVLGSLAVGISINGITSFSFLKGKDKDFGLQPVLDLFVKFLEPYIKITFEKNYEQKTLRVVHDANENEFKDINKEILIDELLNSVIRSKITEIDKISISESAYALPTKIDALFYIYDEFDLQPIIFLRDRIRNRAKGKKEG